MSSERIDLYKELSEKEKNLEQFNRTDKRFKIDLEYIQESSAADPSNNLIIESSNNDINIVVSAEKTIALHGKVSIPGLINVNELSIEGDASFNKSVYIAEELVMDGDASFNSSVDIVNKLNVSSVFASSDVSVNGNVNIGKSLTVDTLLVNSDVSINGDVSLNSNISILNNLDVDGKVSLNNEVDISENLYVNGDVSFQRNLDVSGSITATTIKVLNDISINGELDTSGIIFANSGIIHATQEVNGGVKSYIHKNDGTTSILSNFEALGDASFSAGVNISGGLMVGGHPSNDEIIFGNDVSFQRSVQIGYDPSYTGPSYTSNFKVYMDSSFGESVDISENLNVNNKLIVRDDVSLNNNVDIKGKLHIKNKLETNGDASLNGDVDIAGRLNILGDITMTYLSVEQIDVTSTLTVAGDVSLNANVKMANKLNVAGDVSLNSDVFMANKLNVDGNVSLGAELDVDENLSVAKDLSVNLDIKVGNKMTVGGDVSLNASVDILTDLNVGNKLIVSNDVSLNNHVDITNNLNVGGNIVTVGNLQANDVTFADFSATNIIVNENVIEIGKDIDDTIPVKIGIGSYAGNVNQGDDGIAIGRNAGLTGQGANSVSVGFNAGNTNQGANAIVIGSAAGYTSQQEKAISIGDQAGYNSQGANSIAIGSSSGYTTQAINTVAIGNLAGNSTQQEGSVGLGYMAGKSNQGLKTVAVGYTAGESNQGNYAIAIGSSAGKTNQATKSIILNATGTALNGGNSGLYIDPIRTGVKPNIMQYDTTTKELVYSTQIDIPGTITSSDISCDTLTTNGLIDTQNNDISMGSGNIVCNTVTSQGLVITGDVDISDNLTVSGSIISRDSISSGYNTNTTSFLGRAAIGYNGLNDIASFSHIDSNTAGSYGFSQKSNGRTSINAPTGEYITLGINNIPKVKLATDGKLGIGTTDPTALLHVEGDVSLNLNADVAQNLNVYGDTYLVGKLDVESDVSFASSVTIRSGDITNVSIEANSYGGSGVVNDLALVSSGSTKIATAGTIKDFQIGALDMSAAHFALIDTNTTHLSRVDISIADLVDTSDAHFQLINKNAVDILAFATGTGAVDTDLSIVKLREISGSHFVLIDANTTHLSRVDISIGHLVDTSNAHYDHLTRVDISIGHLVDISAGHWSHILQSQGDIIDNSGKIYNSDLSVAHLVDTSNAHYDHLTRVDISIGHLVDISAGHWSHILQSQGDIIDNSGKIYNSDLSVAHLVDTSNAHYDLITANGTGSAAHLERVDISIGHLVDTSAGHWTHILAAQGDINNVESDLLVLGDWIMDNSGKIYNSDLSVAHMVDTSNAHYNLIDANTTHLSRVDISVAHLIDTSNAHYNLILANGTNSEAHLERVDISIGHLVDASNAHYNLIDANTTHLERVDISIGHLVDASNAHYNLIDANTTRLSRVDISIGHLVDASNAHYNLIDANTTHLSRVDISITYLVDTSNAHYNLIDANTTHLSRVDISITHLVDTSNAHYNLIDANTTHLSRVDISIAHLVDTSNALYNLIDANTTHLSRVDISIAHLVDTSNALYNLIDANTTHLSRVDISIAHLVDTSNALYNLIDANTTHLSRVDISLAHLVDTSNAHYDLILANGTNSEAHLTRVDISIGHLVDTSNTHFNLIDANTSLLSATPGTVVASKAIITDSNKSIAGLADIGITGQLTGPSTLIIDPAAVGDNTGTVVIKGSLQVDGTTTTINSSILDISDHRIYLASNATNQTQTYGAGIEVYGNKTFTYQNGDIWESNIDISAAGITTTAFDVSTINTTGRVGINMNAPLEALDIYGTIKWGEVGAQQTLPFDRGSNGQFLQTDGGGVLTFATIDTVTITDSNTNTSFPIVFNNESGGLLDDTGSFTYNPFTGKMTVDGTANVYGESGSVTSAVFGHSSFTSRQNSGFYQQSTGDTFVNAKPGQVINFNSGYNTKMTMNDLGLFGIGTTTPDASLSVVGNIKASGTLTAGEGTDISCILGYTNIGYTGSNGYVGFSHTANSNFTDFALLQALEGFTVLNAKSGLDIHFTIGLDMKMNLSPAGKLGIGHTFQAYHLDVSGDTMLRVMNNTGAAGKLLFGRTGGNGTTTDNRSHAIEAYSAVGPSNNYLKFLVHDGATSLSDGRTEVMAMTGDGYVGINTDKPTTHLNVLGTISTGRNLAREVGTVTDYSSQFSAARGAANVIDGFKNYENGNHDWLTAAGAKNNAYVTIDLGAAYFVDRIVVYNQNEYAASNREVKHFTLQGSSDGTTFTSILTNELGRSNAHEPNPGWSFRIPQNWDDDNEGIQYRYFKFIMTSFISDVPDKAGIMEIELYEAANTVDDIVSTSAIVAQDVYSQVGNFSRGLTVGPGFGGVATGQSNLFVQGNVGIGLADPTKKLEVIGDISCSGAVESLYCKLGGSTNTGSEFATFSHYNMSNDSDYAFGQIDGFATRINCKSGQTIQFRNNGSTEWARFDSNGNFDCVNNIEAGVSKMGSGTSEGGIAIGLFAHRAMLDDNNYALAQKNGQDTRINAKTGQIIQFNNNGITELARFQPSGNFGIGITNPTKKLEVIGDISSSGGGSFGNAALGNHSGIYAKFHHKDVTGANDYAVIQTDTGRTYLNSKSGQSLFLAINNQVRMTVKAGHQGNIGIGTENPTEKLEVVGNIKATGDIQMETLSTPVIGKMTPIYARGYGQHNASTKIVRIGDVQVVNTTTRGLTLTIINAGTHAHVSSTNYDTLMGSTNGDLLATAIEGLNDDEIGILTSADAFESVGFGGLGANLKAAALKVGLPVLAAFCDWTTNNRHPYAAIFYGPGASSLPSGQAVEITKSRDSSAAYATLSTWLIDDTFIGQVLTTALYNPIGDSTEPVVFVGATGNVGIGSIAPTAKLEVYPDTNINATIGKANIGYNGFGNWAAFSHMDCANTTDYAMMQLNTGITLINSASGQSIQFKNNNSLKMSLSADGQLGIGTTPGYMLQVNGWASNTTVSWINLASGSTTTGQNPTINTIPSGVSIYASHGVMSGTGYFQGSDDRIKSFEVPLALGLDEIIQLEPKSYLKHPEFLVPEDDETGSTLPIDASGNLYQLATDSSGNVIIDSSGNSVKEPMYAEMEYGLISQEMLLIPGMELLVTEDKSVDKIKNVNYTGLIPVLINGIKELKTINDTQAATITAQAAMIAALDARLTALEN